MPPIDTSAFYHFTPHPVALQIGPLAIRWYSLAYIAGILVGWWYMLKLIAQPGAPMARRHADDFVFWATLGVLLGGRLGYILFYNFGQLSRSTRSTCSSCGRAACRSMAARSALSLAIVLFCRKNRLSVLRFADYIACVRADRAVLRPPRQFRERRAVGQARRPCRGRSSSPAAATACRATRASSTRRGSRGWCCSRSSACCSGAAATARYQPGLPARRLPARLRRVPLHRRILPRARRAARRHLLRATGLHMGQWLCVPMIVVGLC